MLDLNEDRKTSFSDIAENRIICGAVNKKTLITTQTGCCECLLVYEEVRAICNYYFFISGSNYFNKTTLTDIAKSLGVTHAAIYKYYKNKILRVFSLHSILN
jgi:hypothetical protein